MDAHAEIEPGVCGLQASVFATSADDRTVTFKIETCCEKVAGFADALKNLGPVDAYQEINPTGTSVVLQTAHSVLKGCCAACVVPVGLFKCMQVAAGLALPKDIQIHLSKD